MAYCTNTDVKTYLDIDRSDDDDKLTTLIARAQEMIDKHTGLTFEASSDTTRTFDAVRDIDEDDPAVLCLDEWIADITTVTNGDSVVVSSSEYTTEPRNVTPYYAIRLLDSSGKAWTYTTDPEDAISVAGKWAFSESPPADVVQACIDITILLYRGAPNPRRGGKGKAGKDGVSTPAAMIRDVLMDLDHYQRKV